MKAALKSAKGEVLLFNVIRMKLCKAPHCKGKPSMIANQGVKNLF